MKAKIWNFSKWISETDSKKLDDFFTDVLKKSGFNIVGETDKHFMPQGYTKLWLLSESHFAIHTFPEHNKTYIELSSCNKKMYKKFKKLYKEIKMAEYISNKTKAIKVGEIIPDIKVKQKDKTEKGD